jgi:hypothetical protein
VFLTAVGGDRLRRAVEDSAHVLRRQDECLVSPANRTDERPSALVRVAQPLHAADGPPVEIEPLRERHHLGTSDDHALAQGWSDDRC